MIEARAPSFAAWSRRISARARVAAEALAENHLRARRHDPRRWRDARLLWPDFTHGD